MSFPLAPRPLGVARLLAPLAEGRPEPAAAAVLAIAEAAGIRGRGGAGFPLAVKLRSVARAPGEVKYVIANAAEGEPTSVKDRYLLRERPDLVLRGLALAARAVGARACFVYAGDEAGADVIERTLKAGGRPDDGPPVTVVRIPPAYVAGEETAVVRAVGGAAALPAAKPPRPFQEGLHGAPTLVSNVETLAQLAVAVTLGARRYRAVGTAASPGTFLLTLSGGGVAAGLYEVPYGTPLRSLAETHLGGGGAVTGVVAGGFAGGLLPASALELPLTHATFTEAGSTLGCGAFVLLTGECPVGVAATIARFFDRQNARQCGVCIKATAGIADRLDLLCEGGASADDVATLERWSTSIAGRGNCATPDAAGVLVGSLVRHHRDLVDTHLRAPCPRCAQGRPLSLDISL